MAAFVKTPTGEKPSTRVRGRGPTLRKPSLAKKRARLLKSLNGFSAFRMPGQTKTHKLSLALQGHIPYTICRWRCQAGHQDIEEKPHSVAHPKSFFSSQTSNKNTSKLRTSALWKAVVLIPPGHSNISVQFKLPKSTTMPGMLHQFP